MNIVPPYLNDMSEKKRKELDHAVRRMLKAKAKYEAALAYCNYCKEQLKAAKTSES